MKKYYEILEVDKNASKEVIEKAYKTLAKKYHPDLNPGVNQNSCAEKFKMVSEAYEILSDEQKRREYDISMQRIAQVEEKRKIEQIRNEAIKSQNLRNDSYYNQPQTRYNEPPRNTNSDRYEVGSITNFTQNYINGLRQAQKQAYNDAYIQDLKNRGYKIRYKHGFKYYLKAAKLLLIIVGASVVIYQIPFVKNFFHELYIENEFFRVIINIFTNTFSAEI